MQAVVSQAGANAVLTLYSSANPATLGGSRTANTDLAHLVCTNPLGTVEDGVLTFGFVNSDPGANRDGTAQSAELRTSGGVIVADFTVGLAGSGADIEMNNTLISQGQQVDLVSGTIVSGNA